MTNESSRNEERAEAFPPNSLPGNPTPTESTISEVSNNLPTEQGYQAPPANQEESENEEERDFNIDLRWMAYFAVACSMLILCVYGFYFDGEISTSQEHWAWFGDFIGGILNPIYAFLALIALLLTISLQLKEMKATRKELKSASQAQISQDKRLEIQSFENSFFQMLRLHNDILNSIDLVRGSGAHNSPVIVTTGRDCFVSMHKRLKAIYHQRSESQRDESTLIVDAYYAFYEYNQSNLAHYFRYLYNILKFIDKSTISNKRFYSNLLRAQLSNHELVIIFYNCLTSYGNEQFRPLAIEYSLFNNLPEKLLLNPGHKQLYPDKAYAQSSAT